jgi:NAD(P)-dependent dehydrogenase (short-subunit alcohol dehydrogenase family)
MTELEGKTALVTGAGVRVGRAIALALAQAGANILVHYNSSSRESDEVAAEILAMDRGVDTIRGDLSDPDQIALMLSELDRHEIGVDILVNSAAVYYPTPLAEVTAEMWDKIIAINLRAPFLLAQGLGLRMKARGSGLIVNIADCNLRRPYKDFTPYFAAKAGIAMITETLALDLAPEVRVNAISPGTVLPPEDAEVEFKTKAINRSPLGLEGDPDDIAQMVVYLAEKGRFITGSNFRVDGGATIR